MHLPKARALALVGALVVAGSLFIPSVGQADEASDLSAARALFERNLQAIRDKNKEAYLSCYLESDRLVRTGPDGPALGYADLAAWAKRVESLPNYQRTYPPHWRA